jgi:acyl-CoA hydrolase
MTQGTLVAVEGEMSKSGTGTVTVTVAFWVKDPLVPVTFTRYIPGEMLVVAVMLS